jgi:signal transduction histidine kinase
MWASSLAPCCVDPHRPLASLPETFEGGGRVRARTVRRIAWIVLGLDVLVTVVGLSLVVANRQTPLPPGVSSVVSDAALLVAFLPYGVIGALILSRQPGNRIGALFLVSGLGIVVGIVAFEYAIYGDLTNPGSLPGTIWALRTSAWLGVVPFAATMFLFLLFPDGHLPSRRWVPVASFTLLSAGWLEANSISPSIPFEPARTLVIVAMLLCASAPVIRYRRSDSVERQQIKWFAFAAFPAVALLIPGLFVNLSGVYFVPFVAAMAAVPFGAGIAVFKYRLYDIDVILDRTIVYGVLAAFITAVYVVVVSVIGAFVGATQVLSLIATAIVAVAFQPVRLRVEGVARRIVYGERATPYETLSTFSGHLSETYSVDDVLPSMARILAEGTGASRAEVWLRVGSELRPAASWPEEEERASPVPVRDGSHPAIVTTSRVEAASREADVRHRGELLGALVVTKPPFERFTPAEEKLVTDLSGQAGLVLRNVALIADLRASRQRIVSAQDEERRKIERNLHDGAQQQLVALAVKMRLIEGMTRQGSSSVADLAHELVEETGEALESLRELAHGIYPPLLADQGLAVALESRMRKAPIPVTLDAGGLGRYDEEVEAAVYFCCLEALQNVGKYASASIVSIALRHDDGWLRFVVTDDGHGFRTDQIPLGSGLHGMKDRLEALGGELEVRSRPGEGTTVSGQIPVSAAIALERRDPTRTPSREDSIVRPAG